MLYSDDIDKSQVLCYNINKRKKWGIFMLFINKILVAILNKKLRNQFRDTHNLMGLLKESFSRNENLSRNLLPGEEIAEVLGVSQRRTSAPRERLTTCEKNFA